MVMQIAAIPTRYAGVNFRSRLEARWAAAFDLLGLSWSYEPIDLDGWSPDFSIKSRVRTGAEESDDPEVDVCVYAEVKPVDLCREVDDCAWLSMFGKAIKHAESVQVLLLGDAPRVWRPHSWLISSLGHVWQEPYGEPYTEHAIAGFFDGAMQLYYQRQCRGADYILLRSLGTGGVLWREAGNKVQWRSPFK